MTRRKLLNLAAATAMVAGFATPAFATHDGEKPPAGCRYIRGVDTPEDHADDVHVCRQDVWIHKGNSRLGNLAATGHDTLPSWNTTPPTAAVQDQAGIFLTNTVHDDLYGREESARAIFRGSFRGTLDTLAFRLHLLAPLHDPGPDAFLSPWYARITLTIDGAVVYDNPFPNGKDVPIPMKRTGNTRRLDAVFVDLYDVLEGGNGPDKVHDVQLEILARYYGETVSVFLYDSWETPSGLTFNLEKEGLPGYTIVNPPA